MRVGGRPAPSVDGPGAVSGWDSDYQEESDLLFKHMFLSEQEQSLPPCVSSSKLRAGKPSQFSKLCCEVPGVCGVAPSPFHGTLGVDFSFFF